MGAKNGQDFNAWRSDVSLTNRFFCGLMKAWLALMGMRRLPAMGSRKNARGGMIHAPLKIFEDPHGRTKSPRAG
jgi:hypothetical protein